MSEHSGANLVWALRYAQITSRRKNLFDPLSEMPTAPLRQTTAGFAEQVNKITNTS